MIYVWLMKSRELTNYTDLLAIQYFCFLLVINKNCCYGYF